MRKYLVNQEYFSIVTSESAYWAGFIAADGHIMPKSNSVRIRLAYKDHYHLEQFAGDVGYTGCAKKYSDASVLCVNAVPQWLLYLREYYNITERKSLTLQPPVLGSNSVAASFISGLIDGDGCISIDKYTYGGKNSPTTQYPRIYLCGTEEVMKWTASWWNYLFPPKLGRRLSGVRKQSKNCFVTSLGGRRAFSFAEYVRTFDLPLLDRKWGKIQFSKLVEV